MREGSLDRRLDGRFVWLLGEMCRRRGIDSAMIDSELSYWENKENIERQTGAVLCLNRAGEQRRVREEARAGEEQADGHWKRFLAEERERRRERNRQRSRIRDDAEDPMRRYSEWARSSRAVGW